MSFIYTSIINDTFVPVDSLTIIKIRQLSKSYQNFQLLSENLLQDPPVDFFFGKVVGFYAKIQMFDCFDRNSREYTLSFRLLCIESCVWMRYVRMNYLNNMLKLF